MEGAADISLMMAMAMIADFKALFKIRGRFQDQSNDDMDTDDLRLLKNARIRISWLLSLFTVQCLADRLALKERPKSSLCH